MAAAPARRDPPRRVAAPGPAPGPPGAPVTCVEEPAAPTEPRQGATARPWATVPARRSPAAPEGVPGPAPFRAASARPAWASGPGRGSRVVPGRSGGGWTRHIVCRYFVHGQCKEGGACRYAHDARAGRGSGGAPGSPEAAAAAPAAPAAPAPAPPPARPARPARPSPAPRSAQPWLPGPPRAPAVARATGPGGWGQAAGELPQGPGRPYAPRGWPSPAAAFPFPALFPFPFASAPYPFPFPAPGPQGLLPRPPRPLSGPEQPQHMPQLQPPPPPPPPPRARPLCRDAALGQCFRGYGCPYVHGDVCDMCGQQALHPADEQQRAAHRRACLDAHERDMELSFAVQRSRDRVCGICMEPVLERGLAAPSADCRFGILSHCNHTFCLRCIRRWRTAKQFENRIIKSCPQCRVTSSFVIPSQFWVEEEAEKQRLIEQYKEAMRTQACRYFARGRRGCPFGDQCFYQHGQPPGPAEELPGQAAAAPDPPAGGRGRGAVERAEQVGAGRVLIQRCRPWLVTLALARCSVVCVFSLAGRDLRSLLPAAAGPGPWCALGP